MDTDTELQELHGTTRILTANEHVKLVPEPTDSPNDPLNWSPARKYWHASLVLLITGFTAGTSNDAGAAGDAMLAELNIDYSVQNTAAGVLFIGIGYWTLLASPMTSLYGRRIMYLICLLFSMIGAVWFAKIMTIQDAIWCQLFVGASESCAEALVQLSLSDLFYQHQRGMVLGLYVFATSAGTFLGPLIAGYIANDNWRWVGWVAAIITGFLLLLFYFGLEETVFHRETILGSKPDASNGEIATVDPTESKLPTEMQSTPQLKPGLDEEKGSQTGSAIVRAPERPRTYREKIALITPAPNLIGLGIKQYLWRLFCTLRILWFPAVVFSGLQWGAQDAWLSFYLTVEEDNWYDPPWNYGNAAVAIMNVPTLIGATIGCVYGGWWSDRFVRWMASKRNGIAEAEDRLWLLLPSAIINPIGLILFGVGSNNGWNWPVPYVGLGFIGFGWGCAGDLSMAYLMDAYPDMVLEGMVGVAVINNSLACIFTFCCSLWLNANGLANTFIAIGVLSFFIQLLTLPMLKWGKAFRRRTTRQYREFLRIRDG